MVHAAAARRGARDAIDLLALTCPATLLWTPAGEQLLLGLGRCTVRVSVASGTLLAGPVHLHYCLSGTDQLETRLHALQRLAGVMRCHALRPALFAQNRKTARWWQVLRALDALTASPRHRAVAQAVFGEPLVARDWTGDSDYLRSRTHRLIRQARALAAGGYRQLLRR